MVPTLVHLMKGTTDLISEMGQIDNTGQYEIWNVQKLVTVMLTIKIPLHCYCTIVSGNF